MRSTILPHHLTSPSPHKMSDNREHSHTFELSLQKRSITIVELQVDRLDVNSSILSDTKACYHRPTGFTALLEITKHKLLESSNVL